MLIAVKFAEHLRIDSLRLTFEEGMAALPSGRFESGIVEPLVPLIDRLDRNLSVWVDDETAQSRQL